MTDTATRLVADRPKVLKKRGDQSESSSPPPAVKLSFNVAQHQVETLKQLAQERGVSMTEVLRHAIALEAFLQNELANDGRIIVENTKDDSRKELVLLGP